MALPPLVLDGTRLDLDTARHVARGHGDLLSLAPDALERVARCRQFVEDVVARGDVVYGITTGFGKLKNVVIPAERTQELQRNLLRSHAVGVGPLASPNVVRLLLLFRLNTLLRGHSGVTVETVNALLTLLRKDVLPRVPEQGSVGASGDLAPLAHLALVLMGEGEALVDGRWVSGAEALDHAGLRPLALGAKEGLALINGTQFSTATGMLGVLRGLDLADLADVACALTLEALLGSQRPFDPRVAALRPHPGHAQVAGNVLRLLAGSAILPSHAACDRVQDAYSLRCAPQVHGAARDALNHAAEVLEREINAVTDNPLLFPDDGETISAGNFHAEPVGLPLDYAKLAVAELGSISERRIEQLVNPDLSNGLPPFLAGGSPGVNSGLMMAQVTAAALVSENKGLAHPSSVDSLPTSANQEDHVSMAPIAGRTLLAVERNVRNVLSIELLAGTFGLATRRPLRAGVGVEAAVSVLEARVAPPGEDREFHRDIAAVHGALDDVLAAVRAAVGSLRTSPSTTG